MLPNFRLPFVRNFMEPIDGLPPASDEVQIAQPGTVPFAGAQPQAGQAPDESSLQLLTALERAKAIRDRGEALTKPQYIENSGTLGVLSALAQAYGGRRMERRADEKISDLTARALTAKQREDAQAYQREQSRKAAERDAEVARRRKEAEDLGFRGRDADRYALTGDVPKEEAWSLGEITDPTNPNNVIPVFHSGRRVVSVDGRPIYGGDESLDAQTAPAAADDNAPASILDPAQYMPAIRHVESRNNPNAVSPVGAVGRMQTMPATLRNPGFGVAPARDDSDAERTRVGEEYFTAMLERYSDPRLALAAYNGGPGRVDATLKAAGGNVDAALRRMPRETREYVPKVLEALHGAASGGSGGAGGQGRFAGSRPRREAKDAPDWQQKIDYRVQHLGESPEEAARAVLDSGDQMTVTTNPDGSTTVTRGRPGRGDGGAGNATMQKSARDALGVNINAQRAFADLREALSERNRLAAVSDPRAQGQLLGKFKGAQAIIRNLQNTGALNINELPFLEEVLNNPATAASVLDPRSTEKIMGQLDALQEGVARSTDTLVKTYPQVFNAHVYERERAKNLGKGAGMQVVGRRKVKGP